MMGKRQKNYTISIMVKKQDYPLVSPTIGSVIFILVIRLSCHLYYLVSFSEILER